MIWKKYWGPILSGVCLILSALVLCVEATTDMALRNGPEMALRWMDFLSGLAMVFWAGSRILSMKRLEQFRGRQVLKDILFLVFGFAAAVIVGVGVFLSVFTYQAERVVERNGIRMVAVENNYQKTVTYYEYKNPLFRGNGFIGFERYDSEGEAPAEGAWEPIGWFFVELEGNVIESGGEYAEGAEIPD